MTKHFKGKLIEPSTCTMYKDMKTFRMKGHPLKREFFKHFGHFTDFDYGFNAQHLLGLTPRRQVPYPKVSMSSTKILVPDNMTHREWIERRKRKKVVLQDLMAIKPMLQLIDKDGNVDDRKWRFWKERHRFSRQLPGISF